MVTMQQVRDDLKEIRYYYSKRKDFETASRCVVESAVTEKVNRYNLAIKTAPARLYDLYIALYTQNNSQVALAEDWGFCNDYIKQLNKQLYVERETYEKDGNTYFSHVVKGNVRGKDVKAVVVPHDVGGYAILDIVFGDAMTAELVLKPYEIKDEKAKRTVKGNTYAVRSVDTATGEVYECPVKPFRSSDKTILNMIVG